MNIILDTNIISALSKGDKKLSEKIDNATSVYIPSIVLGELYYGAYYSQNIEHNLRQIDMLKTTYPLLFPDELTAKAYGHIKSQLRKNGTPIPENDIWIAAIAFRNDLTIITRDKHFFNVDVINVKNW